eukprot:CAMPEP_0204211956 /NCGR_PEP_ID=MMETSP0361-20130328/74871_1 /ASSEMBLY_ACC=CAM_ASM_000343 /TAXON_ID=268821 /ORGANISM="Scrippsiella Hangoei, Strain SHTV-5" /LENGTH=40 /DNA_ID= /DNA_START= /DNA_END= /DNA_ORIENTATION=
MSSDASGGDSACTARALERDSRAVRSMVKTVLLTCWHFLT